MCFEDHDFKVFTFSESLAVATTKYPEWYVAFLNSILFTIAAVILLRIVNRRQFAHVMTSAASTTLSSFFLILSAIGILAAILTFIFGFHA